MEQKFIKLLDKNLKCIDYKLKDDKIVIIAKSIKEDVKCPCCGHIYIWNRHG